MNIQQMIVARIRQLCKERDLTPNGISNISGVPQTTVKSILNGKSQNPGTVTIKNFVTVLKLLLGNSFLRPNSIP